MKKAFVIMLSICLLMFTSCQKETLQSNGKSTAEKILGKWMLVKYQEETYNASNTVIYNHEKPGDQSDSLIFRQDGNLYTYSDTDGSSIDEYQVINDQSIRIEMENWKIARLTDTNFDLISEETDPATKQRDVIKAFLKRQ